MSTRETTTTTIGFDRRIDVEWLDAAAGRIAAGASPADVREFLWSLLDGVVGGDTVHSARFPRSSRGASPSRITLLSGTVGRPSSWRHRRNRIDQTFCRNGSNSAKSATCRSSAAR
jgi:hypothetical protein